MAMHECGRCAHSGWWNREQSVEEGWPTSGGYPLLHTLPLFQEGGVPAGSWGPLPVGELHYRAGDFPVTEAMRRRLVFLPVLTDPVPGAAEQVLAALRKVATHAERLSAASTRTR